MVFLNYRHMRGEGSVHTRLETAFYNLLGADVSVEIRAPARVETRADFQVTLAIDTDAYETDVNWCKRGSAAEVTDALARPPTGRPVILAADRFTRSAINLLNENDANWLSAAGGAHLRLEGLIAVVEQPRAPVGPNHDLKWTPLVVGVAEVLLANATKPDEWIRGGDLTDAIGLSPGRASQILQAFDSAGWTEKTGTRGRGAHRRLADPRGLLGAFAEAAVTQRARSRRWDATVADPDLLNWLSTRGASALTAHLGTDWALSGEGAGQLLVPYLTATRFLTFWVDELKFTKTRSDLFRASAITSTERGARIVFRAVPHQSLLDLSKAREGIRLATPARIYADLLTTGERAEEAASEIQQLVLGA